MLSAPPATSTQVGVSPSQTNATASATAGTR